MLQTVAWISLIAAFLSSAMIAIDEVKHPQKMAIMNVVWPVTALYFSIFALWAYFRIGRKMARDRAATKPYAPGNEHQNHHPNRHPSASQTALAVSHCGAGCVLADIAAEYAVFALGLRLFGSTLWASYLLDFVAAWSLGVVFQYFTIKPMRNLSPLEGIRAAIKADTLSILAFQVGMYAWMALVFFKLFPHPHLEANNPAYWLMMQIGMICGFLTAYPMNSLLVRTGLKEAMG
jgi:hypothetical protein